MTLAILMNLGFAGSGAAVSPTEISLVSLRGHPVSRHQKRRYAQQASIILPVAGSASIGGVFEAAARTDSSETAISLTSVTDPADAPATADALRDDLVANALSELQTRDAELETSVETLAGEFNDLLAKLRASGALSS